MEYLNPSRVDEDAGRPGRTGRDPLEVLLGFAGMYDGAIPSTPSGVSREGNPAAREGIASAREGNIAREKRARGNAKPSASAHICESIPGFCQVNRNAKPICQTIGKEIFKVFFQKQECQAHLQNRWSCSNNILKVSVVYSTEGTRLVSSELLGFLLKPL